MRDELRRFAAALTGTAADATLPPLLDAAVARLEASPWPEMATRWSRLTPGGCPVEFTVRDGGDPGLRWTAEVAGPEIAEDRRLALAAGLLAEAGQPLSPRLAEPFRTLHLGAAAGLRFGAWLGGRERGRAGEPSRLKLYAELPDGLDPTVLGRLLPGPVEAAIPRLPRGTLPRMLGIEPARGDSGGRIELYLRLPGSDPHELLPILHVTGHEAALPLLDRALPDGLRRLAGRRLGLSLAASGDGEEGPVELALFASARSLFPVDPMMAACLVPSIARLDPGRVRWGLVTLGLDPAGRRVSAALGLPGLPHWRTPLRGSDGLSQPSARPAI